MPKECDLYVTTLKVVAGLLFVVLLVLVAEVVRQFHRMLREEGRGLEEYRREVYNRRSEQERQGGVPRVSVSGDAAATTSDPHLGQRKRGREESSS